MNNKHSFCLIACLALLTTSLNAMEQEGSSSQAPTTQQKVNVILTLKLNWGGYTQKERKWDVDKPIKTLLDDLKTSHFASNETNIRNIQLASARWHVFGPRLKSYDKIKENDTRLLSHWVNPGDTLVLRGQADNTGNYAAYCTLY